MAAGAILAMSAAGAYVGYAAVGTSLAVSLGFTAGSILGQMLFAEDGPNTEGPRLSKLELQSSAYGRDIPKGWGSYRLAGNVIWSNDIQEHEHEDGGKGGGGGSYTYYTYTCSFAVGFCEGPVVGIRRIWGDGKLIYDLTPSVYGTTGILSVTVDTRTDIVVSGDFRKLLPVGARFDIEGSSDNDGTKYVVDEIVYDGSQTTITIRNLLSAAENDGKVVYGKYINRVADYMEYMDKLSALEKITFYLGTEDQLPDTLMESVEGAGNVPGYRGLAYLVFEDLPLADFANRIPNIEVEIAEMGEHDIKIPLKEGTYYFDIFDNGYYIEATAAAWKYVKQPDTTKVADIPDGNTVYIIPDQKHFDMAILTSSSGARGYHYRRVPTMEDLTQAPLEFCNGGNGDRVFWEEGLEGATLYGPIKSEDTGVGLAKRTFVAVFSHPAEVIAFLEYLDGEVVGMSCEEGDLSARTYTPRIEYPWDDPVNYKDIPNYGVYEIWWDLQTTNLRLNSHDNLIVMNDGPLGTGIYTYTKEDFEHQTYQERLTFDFSSDIFNLLPAADPEEVNLGMLYAEPHITTYVVVFDGISTTPLAQKVPGDMSEESLDAIVAEILVAAGLDETEYDVSALSGDLVTGFVRTHAMSGLAALRPLMQAFQFDLVECDWTVKAVKRGGASVADIPAADLGAHEYGRSPVEALVEKKRAELELPKTIEISFLDPGLDYQQNVVRSMRQNKVVASKATMRIAMPLVISATKAMQIAEILHQAAWQERHTYQAQVSSEYIDVLPGDAVTVDDRRARVGSLDLLFPNLIALSLAKDDAGAYLSEAVVADGDTDPSERVRPGAVAYPAFLNLPNLGDVKQSPGVYIAAYTYDPENWKGAALYRSVDDGGTWDMVAFFEAAAVAGFAQNALGSGETDVIDEVNTLTVSLFDSSESLESAAELSVFAGANSLAVGVYDRWEVISFLDAAQNDDGTYTLSNLIRGRRGTEHNVGTHKSGDMVILLSGEVVKFLKVPDELIDTTLDYRMVGNGRRILQAGIRPVAAGAEPLMPYSPVHVSGTRNGDGDLTITWIRRSRVEGGWNRTDVPMLEESEAYEVDILDGSGDVVRTIEAGSASAAYTAAQQAADFGSAQSSVDVTIYQMSAVVGRGYPAEATV